MALRYPELIGGTGDDLVNANNYVAMFGLQGADDFGGASSLQIGGSGNDYYYISVPAIVTVMERSGQGDVLNATAIGLARETTRAITLDQRHLFLFDTASAQAVVLLDWQQPASRIDTWILAGGTYSYDQFIAAVSGFPRFEGNFTWEGAAAAQYFTLAPGETTAVINESLDFYKARSIALEQPAFSVNNNDTGSAGTVAAIPYSGPVSRLDLQFVASDSGEVIGGTAFSDFINAAGGSDAVNGGLGDDVIDGGLGSNFLTGGAGADIFFLDGRGGGITWSTITDWEAGEQLTIWGWIPGVSTSAWSASDGTPGWTGVTLHCDLNADGTIDTSVTWAGRTQADLPAPQVHDGVLWFALTGPAIWPGAASCGLLGPHLVGPAAMPPASRLPLYGTIAALALTRLAFGFQLQTVATLGPGLMLLLALDFAALGALIGAYLAPGVFVALPGGFLARRFGDRAVAIGSAWLLALGGTVAALAVQEGWGSLPIAAGRAIGGIGAVGLSVMQSKMAADRFTPQQLPLAMAVLLGTFPIGIGLAQVILPPLAAAHGIAAAFWLGAVAAIVAAALFTFAWTEPAHAIPRSLAWPSRRELVLVSIAGLIWMVYNAGWFNFLAWMPSLLVARGHPAWVADTVLSVSTWANLPAMLAGGWAAARFGRRPVFIVGTLVCALSVAAPALHDMPILWGVVFGTVAAMHGGLIVELGALSCRAENRAVGMGVFYVTYYVGGAVMPALCGAAADWAGDPGGALVFAAAVSLLALPLWALHARLAARG